MRLASEVDSFHGHEGDIAVTTMGTAHPNSGPDFASLTGGVSATCLLTYQRCGLAIFNGINFGGPYRTEKARNKVTKKGEGGEEGQGQGAEHVKFKVEDFNRGITYVKVERTHRR